MQKTIIITGGSRGIGLSIAKVFAQNGFKVAITGKNSTNLALAIDQLNTINPGNNFSYNFDISIKSETQLFGKSFIQDQGIPEVIVNNAGVFIPGSLVEEEDGIFEKQLNTNLSGAYHLTRCFVKHMIQSNGEYIFNICSTASKMAYPNGGSYSISKFALLGFSKGLREELKDTKIGVSAILPGATFTDSWEGTTLPKNRFIQTDDIAQIIWNAYTLRSTAVQEEIIIRPQLGDI